MMSINQYAKRTGRRQIALRAAVLGAAVVAGAAPLKAQDIGIPVGATASNITVETLDGTPAPMSVHWGKRPVLLEFWATWCPNCEKLEPVMKRITSRYGDSVEVIGVTISFNQKPERVKRFVEQHELKHRIVYDRAGDAGEAYRVPATSYVVVVDANGRVVYTGLGGDQDLEAAVAKVMVSERARLAGARKPGAQLPPPRPRPNPR